MPLFPFGRKQESGRGYSFSEIPLFSSLSPAEIRLIEKKIRLVEFKRGDYVYEEGKPAEAFYVIVSGRFRIFQKSRGEGEKTLTFLYRGDYFGESSLLTGHVHSAWVEARSDGLILRIEKEDFLKILAEIPSLALHLSRTLGHRLTKIGSADRRKREVKIAALSSGLAALESFIFFLDLATNLVRETKARVIVLDFLVLREKIVPPEFESCLRSPINLSQTEISRESDLKPCLVDCPAGFQYLALETEKGNGSEQKLSTLITFLSYRYDFILIRLGRAPDDFSFRALKQSDFIYLLLDPSPAGLTQSEALIRDLERTYGFSKNEIKLIFPDEEGGQKVSYEEKEKRLGQKIFSLLPSRNRRPERYHAALRFVSRELGGNLLGLVLGSGAAYGLAHIGVLKVLEKENIPIDILAGSSMGALVAAFWAAGYHSQELEKIAAGLDQKSAFMKLIGFGDFSLAHHGFFHGRQIIRYMESFFGDQTFQDLAVPVKVVATSLTSSEEVVFESGRVVDAVRASISIPGIFRPFGHLGQVLIDGGILNPLPVDVLASRGVKKIIAVDVLSSPEDRSERGRIREEKRKGLRVKRKDDVLWRHLWDPLLQKVSGHFSNNIFNVIMNTIQIMEYEIAQVAGQEADVLIRPVVHDAHWAEFYRGDKFIKAGEEKTLEQIDEIKRLLVE